MNYQTFRDLPEDDWKKLCVAFLDVFTLKEIEDIVEEALAHKAAKKYSSTYLYLRNWLRKDAEKRRERNKPRHLGNYAPPSNRDVSKYAEWPDGRRR